MLMYIAFLSFSFLVSVFLFLESSSALAFYGVYSMFSVVKSAFPTVIYQDFLFSSLLSSLFVPCMFFLEVTRSYIFN